MWPLVGLFFAMVSVPLAVLVGLVGFGLADPLAAILAALPVVLAGLVATALWGRELALLRRALRLADADNPASLAALPARAWLPGITDAADQMQRLARRLGDLGEQIAQLRRADEAIVERLPDPLIVLGEDRMVRRTNLAARQAFGAELASVLRQPALRAAIDQVLTQGTAQSVALSLGVPVARAVQASLVRLDPPLADGGRCLVLLSDRTRERALEQMRADFVANASHELRTPLASLIGFIDTLRGPARDDAPAQARFLGIMAEQADRMRRLIDDLLSLSRVELTEHEPPLGRVDLAALAQRMGAELEPRLAARGMHLRLAIQPDLPPVAGDGDQLAQVLANLLDNAVKYGREGGDISLSVALPSDGPVLARPALALPVADPAGAVLAGTGRWPARPGLVVSVRDDGLGIARDHLPRLTERFYRVDKGRSRAVGGTGLGLAIVKHIVSRHRGQLAVESEEGQGTVFHVWLPIGPTGPPPALGEASAAQPGPA